MKKRTAGKKIFVGFLALALVIAGLTVPGLAVTHVKAVSEAENTSFRYFYGQLNDRAKKIYDTIYTAYAEGRMKDGVSGCDLVKSGAVTQADLESYAAGDRTLSDDFAAAKDAFDLDQPGAWYIDTSYLSLRVGRQDGGDYSAVVGTGRSDSYYVAGLSGKDDVVAKDAELEKLIEEITAGAEKLDVSKFSDSDKAARRVQYVHDEITKRISYRFETDCKAENTGYIRTLYALATHEGVCESYARAMQEVLNRLEIPCVLVHGIQNSGNSAEMHMWNAVEIGGRWYAVDATWDDPIRLDKSGNAIQTENGGCDGGENDTYLLVGTEVIGRNWLPSGVVSDGNKEFSYPDIQQRSYNGENVYQDAVGLNVEYTAMAEVEGAEAGQWTIDYNGMGMKKAADEGFYLILKMYDEHPNGTSHQMDDWYYAAAALALTQGNEFFYDTDTFLKMCTATCEYVEFALTTRRPDGYETWGNPASSNGLSNDPETGWYHGDGSDIIAETGLLYNMNSDYEAAPYISKQYPDPSKQGDIYQQYRVHIEYDDTLYHPTVSAAAVSMMETAPEAEAVSETETISGEMQPFITGAPETEDSRKAAGEEVRLSYACYQQDRDGNVVPYELAGEVDFDKDRDGLVDNVDWIYNCENEEPGHQHSPETCAICGLEFDYKASSNWSDDMTMYAFQITGLVGSRSNRVPNSWEYIMKTNVCPQAYKSYGIDWTLWGRPSLLDNPDDLDLSKLAAEGIDGSKETLASLQEKMKVDNMNGRLMLVVEEIGAKEGLSREKYEEVTDAFEQYTDLSDDAVKSSSMYEINFTRLCKKTVVMEGESLRMQVGFPQGYDAEDVANKTVVFKAYHFTRCSASHPCGNEKKPGHSYGDDIVSVEEIPVAVTANGLVILCDSFSPFELVALDASKVGADELEKEHKVVVNTDGNGTVACDDVPAVGKDGFITFAEGESHTFTIRPKDGYAVDVVAFGGQPMEVKGNQFILRYEDVTDGNELLNVAFAPVSVKEAEETEGLETIIPNRSAEECAHETTEVMEAREAGCEESGSTEGLRCAECHKVLVAPEPIAAKGHTLSSVAGKEATETEDGVLAHWLCQTCGKRFKDAAGTEEIALADTVLKATGKQETAKPGTTEAESASGATTAADTDGAGSGGTTTANNAAAANGAAGGKTDGSQTVQDTAAMQTGDAASTALWLALLLGSAAAAVIAARRWKNTGKES